MQQAPNSFHIRMNGIMGLIMVILFFVLLFFIAKGIFQILALAAPVLIILALIINYRTVLGFLRFIWDLLRKRPLVGVLAILLSIVGFPVVCGFLFGKSIFDRRIRRIQKEVKYRREGKLIDYEDVTEDAEVLELETLPNKRESKNMYDDFFEEDPDRK